MELLSVKTLQGNDGQPTVYENEAFSTTEENGKTTKQETEDEKDNGYLEAEAEAEVGGDEEETPNCFANNVMRVQETTSEFWAKHKQQVKFLLLILLIVGYTAYFAYAMYYEFGDEGSIRLLWVSCFVLFCISMHVIWTHYGDQIESLMEPCLRVANQHPHRINYSILLILYIFVITFTLVDIFYTTNNPYNLVSASGIVVYVILLFVFSYSPSKVKWQTVGWGFALQFLMAIIILRWSFGYEAFKWLGDRVSEFLAYVNAASEFVFGPTYADHFFAFQVLPTIIFFSATISVLYYLGAMQYVIIKVARVMQACMGTTACESVNAAANIFIGQTEAPLLIRPLMKIMTKSELHAVMTGGFATISGSVLGAYILFGAPANHLLAASVMSAPAALAVSKLVYPETDKTKTDVKNIGTLFEPSGDTNIMEALSSGASNAIPLVANIAANIIAFLAALEFLNATLTWFGQRVGIEELTFEFICSYVLWPFAVLMGVDLADCRTVAGLIGIKTFLNEFIAYEELGVIIDNGEKLDAHIAMNGTYYQDGLDIILQYPSGNTTTLENGVISDRSVVIATYALCGFSNIGSIGIQLGAFTAMAPNRRTDLASLVGSAMIAGSIACFTTACIAGLYYQPL